MLHKASVFLRSLPNRFTLVRKKTLSYIDKRPLRSFFTILGVILVLIILSNFLNRTQTASLQKPSPVKQVSTYRIGKAPKVTVQAQIRKTGVIQIVALSSGIVTGIHQTEGSIVDKGSLLVSMASNYQGGNVLSLQRQLAYNQYQSALATYPTQKEILQKQKELAQKTDENSDKQREITTQSINETKNLISLNDSILSTLDTNIGILQQTATDSALLESTQRLKSQFVASNNQAKDALRITEYSANGDKPPAQLSDIQREIALKQLDVQDKQLDLTKEVSKLQLRIAQVNEGAMFPVAPFRSTVQRVLVTEQQQVTPGTPLMILSQVEGSKPTTAVAFVTKDIAQRISVLEPSILHLGSSTFEVTPSFVSTEAVEGSLYAVYYPIPSSYNQAVISNGFITVEIPVGYFDTTVAITYIPLDAVYQTQEKSYIFVAKNGRAKSREVHLGEVFGRFVEVKHGIVGNDAVIVNRNVIEGDRVTTQ